MFAFLRRTPKECVINNQIKQLIECRTTLEARHKFLLHKLKDITNAAKSARTSQKHMISNRKRALQAMSDNTFSTQLTIDGLIDSIVTLGVMDITNQLLAANAAVDAAETLMSSLSDHVADVNEIGEVLARDICDTDTDLLLEMLEEDDDDSLEKPPVPPTEIPQAKHARHRTRVAAV